jgi:hypothetical protein
MTKLEQLVQEIKTLPEATQEQAAQLLAAFAHSQKPFIFTDEESKELDRRFSEMEQAHTFDEVFLLTDAELADLDNRIKNDTVTFTHEEVMAALREKHAADIGS